MVHIFGGGGLCIGISINFHVRFVSRASSNSGVGNILLWRNEHSPVFYACYFGNSYIVITVAILHMGAVYRHSTDAAKDRYNYLLFQTKMNTHPLFPHTRHTPCCNSSCCGTDHVNSLILVQVTTVQCGFSQNSRKFSIKLLKIKYFCIYFLKNVQHVSVDFEYRGV